MTEKKLSLADWQQQRGRTADSAPATAADGLVYSTDTGRIKAETLKKESQGAFSDGKLRLKRETKGRHGKGVITIAGFSEPHERVTEIAAILKKKCGTGGSVKDGIIEIQGDQRDVVMGELEKLGYSCKWAGG